MGGAQAAKVMEIITLAKFARMGVKGDRDAIAAMGNHIAKQLDAESEALYATARIWDDGIIDPRDTRTVLGLALSASHSNVIQGSDTYGVWRH